MARPAQYERDDDLTRDVTAVKAAIKHLTPADRAHLATWLLLYYDDEGGMFSPQVRSQRRKRLTIDDQAYLLVKVPRNDERARNGLEERPRKRL